MSAHIQNFFIRQRKIIGIFRMVLFCKQYLKQVHVGMVNYFGIRWTTKTIIQNAFKPLSLPTKSKFPRKKQNSKTVGISPYNAYCSTICILYVTWIDLAHIHLPEHFVSLNKKRTFLQFTKHVLTFPCHLQLQNELLRVVHLIFILRYMYVTKLRVKTMKYEISFHNERKETQLNFLEKKTSCN